jgi:type II secretory pathway pseudopilin PulG
MSKRERGMTLLESLLALMALVTLMTLCAQVLQHHSRQSAALSTAQLLKKTGHSVRAYMEDHPYEIKSENIFSKSKMIDAGYFLPEKPNAYQQIHNLKIVSDTSQKTQACIITQDGKPIPPSDWKRIEPLLEGYGGYCDQNTGVLIGWQQPLTAQRSPLLKLLKPGHLILCYPLQTSQLPPVSAHDGLLYRKEIPTHPQYQQMKTDLDMQQHAIVFDAPHQQGALSALGAEFQHTTPAGRQRASIEWGLQGAESAYPITLQNPEQQQLRISPSAVHLAAPSIITGQGRFNYNTLDRKLTVTTIPPHYGLQWHRNWHQLPYHHLPYEMTESKEKRQKKLDNLALRICHLEQNTPLNQAKMHSEESNLYPRLGRMFIVGHFYHQQSTVFICGKSKIGKHTRPYPLYSTSPLPQEKIERTETKNVIGLKFHILDQTDSQKSLQQYLFLYDSIEKILFFITLEEAILKALKRETVGDQKILTIINQIKENKENCKALEKIKNSQGLKKRIQELKEISPGFYFYNTSNITELFFNYLLDRCKNNSNHLDDKAFLRSLLQQLKDCEKKQENNSRSSSNEVHRRTLDEKKLKETFSKGNVKIFLLQCKDFKTIPPSRWMQTVYVLSHDQHLAEHPLYELNLTELTSN